MKLDEFAFFNQQLAGMLKSGIPLETALRQLCAGMRGRRWRREFERLQADLAQGVPLEKALDARALPDLYKQMVKVGARSNNLPALLTLLADHYHKAHFLWTRLKGLMLYPALVLLTALGLSVLLLVQCARLTGFVFTSMFDYPFARNREIPMEFYKAGTILPALVLGALTAVMLAMLLIPAARRAARWWLPGFKEAQLSRLASSMGLLLQGGVDLGAALGLMRRLEPGGGIGRELTLWDHELSQGGAKMSDMAQKTKTIPPLFFWLVAGEGENLPAGFGRAAEIYYARAAYKADLVLNSFLPISVVGLGSMIVIQILATIHLISNLGLMDLWAF